MESSDYKRYIKERKQQHISKPIKPIEILIEELDLAEEKEKQHDVQFHEFHPIGCRIKH